MRQKTLTVVTCSLLLAGMLGGSVFAGVVVAPGGKEQNLTDSDKSRKKFKCNDGIMNTPLLHRRRSLPTIAHSSFWDSRNIKSSVKC